MHPQKVKKYEVGQPVVVDYLGHVYGSIITDSFIGDGGRVRLFLLGNRSSIDAKYVELV